MIISLNMIVMSPYSTVSSHHFIDPLDKHSQEED